MDTTTQTTTPTASKKQYIVVALSARAGDGAGRNRGGHRFTAKPSVAWVTDEQLLAIKGDVYLRMYNFPSMGWFEGMGIDRTEDNEKKYAKKLPENPPKNANMAQELDKPKDAITDPVEAERTANDATDLTAGSDKERIIEALEAKGKKAGVDFNASTSNDILFKLLQKA